MKFFLDQNVDARLRKFLTERGHSAWTADDAGLSRENDPNLTVYSMDRGAALITHDVEFSRRRRRNVMGWHIFLDCKEPHAREVMGFHFDDVYPILQRYPDLYVAMTRTKFEIVHASESWQ